MCQRAEYALFASAMPSARREEVMEAALPLPKGAGRGIKTQTKSQTQQPGKCAIAVPQRAMGNQRGHNTFG